MKLKTLMEERKMKFGIPQTAGNMIVVPIISETQNLDISEDMLFSIKSDSDYAHLTLQNTEDRDIIVPQGTSYMNKQSAQDRIVLSANVIKGKTDKTVNVGCIESSQGGHMAQGTEDETFISSTIRSYAMDKDKQLHTEYDILWDDIKAYNKKLGVNYGRSHINDFYNEFNHDLERNASHFEKVKNQIGGVIIINNIVAGIEMFPNFKSWSKVWRKIIRDSYGADALVLVKQNKAVGFRPFIDVDRIDDIKKLEEEVINIIIKTNDNIIGIVNTVIEKEFTIDDFSVVGDYSITNFVISKLRGQSVKKGTDVVYLTAVGKVV